MVKLYPCWFRFGLVEPLPVIKGFEVIAKPNEFLMARQGDKLFFVEVFPRGYRLALATPHPWDKDGEGICYNASKCIWIPKED
jgi:hypothetical protein